MEVKGGDPGGGRGGPISGRAHPPGVKHLEELVRARRAGYEAAVCFVIQMEDVIRFQPNDRTHPAFGQALRAAAAAGVGGAGPGLPGGPGPAGAEPAGPGGAVRAALWFSGKIRPAVIKNSW